MLRYDTKSWWKLIFQFHEGDTLRTLLPNILIVALFSLAVVYFNSGIMPGYLKYTATVHNLFGFVISLLLVFRTNTAYDRWWEGRRFWGSLVNTSRNIALKCHSYLDAQDSIRETIAFDIYNFAEALKNQLRGHAKTSQARASHTPSLAAEQLLVDVTDLNRQGYLTEVQFLTLNTDITALLDICGGCERIKNTPIPFSYHVFIKKFVFFYIISMPFVFAPEFGYWTVLVTSFMFYVLASLEILAEEIENPFGSDTNDLPLDELTAMIRKNVDDILIGFPRQKIVHATVAEAMRQGVTEQDPLHFAASSSTERMRRLKSLRNDGAGKQMIMITMDDGRGLRAIDAVWEAVWSGNQTLTESPRVKGFSNSHGDDSSTRKT